MKAVWHPTPTLRPGSSGLPLLARLAGAWLPRRHRARRASPRPLDRAIERYLADISPERPAGCGWFDSSQDLREGLSVREHRAGEAANAALPLAAWIEVELGGWRPTAQG